MAIEVKVPDIGDFKDVPIIEVHVQAGARVKTEDPLITLESDKATMDVPAPQAGTVAEIKVAAGDRVGEGAVILLLEPEGAAAIPPKERVKEGAAPGSGEPATYGSSAGAYETIEVNVPDIGDFKDVPVIEVHVTDGATVKAEDPLLTLESDKATMDVPSPAAGTVTDLKVKVGDRVGEGTLILHLQTGAAKPAAATTAAAPPAPATAPTPKAASTAKGDYHAEVLVLGAGPGGYSAAFRAADLGRQVILVERWPTLGGVCLNVGCIPSKALLHAAKVIAETEEMGHFGVKFAAPTVDIEALRGWKDGVVKKLTGGLSGLAKARKVTVVSGIGRFTSLNQLEVEDAKGGRKTVSFEQAIIAAGSEPVTLPFIPHADPRVIDSTGALELGGVPKRLLVVGGGIIGLEMATVYHALGAKVTIVELMDQIIPGADKDLVTPLYKRIGNLKAKVTNVEAKPEGFTKQLEGQLAAWQGQIKDYQERMAQAGGSLSEQAKTEYEKGLAQLKASTDEAGKLLAQAREASEGAWKDMQAASGKAFAQLQQGWADALKRFQ